MEECLAAIVATPELHARWLNSLSYLEYRGFRKIARSFDSAQVTEDVLLHAMEEVKHAVFFKKLAIKVGGPSFSGYSPTTLLGGTPLKAYFSKLEFTLRNLFASSGVSPGQSIYQLLTWVVEKRAMQVYQLYDRILKSTDLGISLKVVLIDESKHLKEMEKSLQSVLDHGPVDIQQVHLVEENLFIMMWQSFERDCLTEGVT